LGADPDTRYMPSGKAVTNIRIATSESWKDRQTGDQQERTEWHTVVLFDKLGEIAAEYLRKGSQVYIEGSLRTRKWQDKEGKDRYSTEIVAREMQMLGGRGGGAGGGEPRPARSARKSSHARCRCWEAAAAVRAAESRARPDPLPLKSDPHPHQPRTWASSTMTFR